MMASRPFHQSLNSQNLAAPDPSLLYESPSNLRHKSRQSAESCGDEDEQLPSEASAAPSRGRCQQGPPVPRGGDGLSGERSTRSLSADRNPDRAPSMAKNNREMLGKDRPKQRFLNIFDDEWSTETSSVDLQSERVAPASSGFGSAAEVVPRDTRPRQTYRKGSYDSLNPGCIQRTRNGSTAKAGQRRAPVYYSESAATSDVRGTWAARGRKRFPHLLHSPSQDMDEESTGSDEEDDRLHWKGWRKLLAERQRDLERHMEQQRELTKQNDAREVEAEQMPTRTRKPIKEGVGSSHIMETEEDGDEDPLGIKTRQAFPTRGRSALPAGARPQPDSDHGPVHPFMGTMRMPPSVGQSAPGPPNTPGATPFYGPPFVPPAPFYPGWPPPYYAAAVAAAAAARKVGEKAGITGQEMIQELKKTLEETRDVMKKKEEEAKKALEEEEKRHSAEKEELEKQLAELRESSEQRARELVGAELKQGELEKQIKMLREEFDILTRVHNELKEQFGQEKEGLINENNNLTTKVQDLENDLSFSKDQLLVARESLIAARAKQQTATEAHEQDLKTLQEYRRENETLKEDIRYLKTLNTSLNEKVQRLLNGKAERGNDGEVSTATRLQKQCGFPPHVDAKRLTRPCPRGLFPPDANALQQLFSPQVQQRLLKDRQKESLAAGDGLGVKEATFSLPGTAQGATPTSSAAPEDGHCIPDSSSMLSQSPRTPFPPSENRGAPRAHKLSSVEMRFLAHLHQRGQVGGQSVDHDFSRARLAPLPQADMLMRNLPMEADGPQHVGAFGRGGASRARCPRLPSVNSPGRGGDCLSAYQGNAQYSSGARPPLFPSLPFADKVPTDGSVMSDGHRQILKDPFSHMSPLSSNPGVSALSTESECAFPGSPSSKPYICRPSVIPSSSQRPAAPAKVCGVSPRASPTSVSGAASFPGSGGPSTLNSARTQWLLQRVSRISRLHGLQNIQDKLKDFPPALLAAASVSSKTVGSNVTGDSDEGKEETSSTHDGENRTRRAGKSESGDCSINN
ncbi:hypothetical protein BESB_001300 [Besnoitia besnoiti]|uniref:Uncharacterized protein n=1 Tax=Besnoitia besnoiti TaxID=94643 RepID=A0A2A9MGY5_BESBE|nr:hypothetical protein BESB_001300 [Besnoitia besnoiti]PFH37788.1 hypothetical protein BESB_001300 [Besnoitia besnoiti]